MSISLITKGLICDTPLAVQQINRFIIPLNIRVQRLNAFSVSTKKIDNIKLSLKNLNKIPLNFKTRFLNKSNINVKKLNNIKSNIKFLKD